MHAACGKKPKTSLDTTRCRSINGIVTIMCVLVVVVIFVHVLLFFVELQLLLEIIIMGVTYSTHAHL